MPVKAAQEPSGRATRIKTCVSCGQRLAGPSTTKQRDQARHNRDRQIAEKLALVALLTAQDGIVAHLAPCDGAQTEFWQWTVCVHSPAGQLSWHITTKEAADYFGHLPQTSSDWDGHRHTDKHDRVMTYLNALPRAPRSRTILIGVLRHEGRA